MLDCNFFSSIPPFTPKKVCYDQKRKGYKPPDLSVEKIKDFIIIPSP